MDILSTGARHWWKMNLGTGTAIEDYGAATDFDGTASGATWVFDQYSVNVQDNTTTTDGAVTVTQGKLEGLSLTSPDFDGANDYITLGSSVELEDYDWSMSCWFNADEFSSNTLLGHSNGEHLIQLTNSTTLRSNFSNNGNEDITVSGLSTDKWHHLTYTRDDSTLVAGCGEDLLLRVLHAVWLSAWRIHIGIKLGLN